MISPELIAEERKNLRISGLITTAIMVVLLLLTLLFTAYRTRKPPPGKKYEVFGAIDFGDNREGSQKVNTKERSVPNPSESKPQPAKTTPTPKPATPTPTPPPEITTKKPTPISKPTPPPVKKPVPVPDPPKPEVPKKTTPDTKPTTTPTKPSTSKPSEKPVLTLDDGEPGSNHGNKPGSTGNSGTPNTTVLDKDGLYSFGKGVGGSSGRGIVFIKDPVYNVQEEAELKFTFTINEDGSVGRIERPITNKSGLVRAGMAAIRSWKFTPAPGSGPLKTSVTIKFKLK